MARTLLHQGSGKFIRLCLYRIIHGNCAVILHVQYNSTARRIAFNNRGIFVRVTAPHLPEALKNVLLDHSIFVDGIKLSQNCRFRLINVVVGSSNKRLRHSHFARPFFGEHPPCHIQNKTLSQAIVARKNGEPVSELYFQMLRRPDVVQLKSFNHYCLRKKVYSAQIALINQFVMTTIVQFIIFLQSRNNRFLHKTIPPTPFLGYDNKTHNNFMQP